MDGSPGSSWGPLGPGINANDEAKAAAAANPAAPAPDAPAAPADAPAAAADAAAAAASLPAVTADDAAAVIQRLKIILNLLLIQWLVVLNLI